MALLWPNKMAPKPQAKAGADGDEDRPGGSLGEKPPNWRAPWGDDCGGQQKTGSADEHSPDVLPRPSAEEAHGQCEEAVRDRSVAGSRCLASTLLGLLPRPNPAPRDLPT
jgi:hypothetical protein